MSRVDAGDEDEIRAGTVRAVPIGRDADGYVQEVIVLRDGAGVLRAYHNVCKHLPIPLDGGSRRFLDPSGRFLECGTHGATYRPEDGLCIAGPCEGERLDPVPLEIEGGRVYLRLAD
jgi:nitrite reductase/ring-hydroxylating ferredoxin subunit